MTKPAPTHTRRDVNQAITDQIVEELERGVRPWLKPWSTEHMAGRVALPLRHNGVAYSGVNVLSLWMAGFSRGYGSPVWMTFKQAVDLAGAVRKGEKGSLTVFANTLTRTETDAEAAPPGGFAFLRQGNPGRTTARAADNLATGRHIRVVPGTTMAVEHEVVLEFSKMVTEHTASLWKIASGFVALEVLIISHVLMRTRPPFRERVVWWLSISAAFNVASLVCGYIADAGLLWALKEYAKGIEWKPSGEAELFNFFQMVALTVGLAVFVGTFLCNSRIMADSFIRAGGHGGKSEKGE